MLRVAALAAAAPGGCITAERRCSAGASPAPRAGAPAACHCVLLASSGALGPSDALRPRAAPQRAPAPLVAARRQRRGASLVAAARDRSKAASDKPAAPPPGDKTASPPPPPPAVLPSVDEGAPPRDFWEGEQFEALGTFGYVALFIVAGLAGACCAAPLCERASRALNRKRVSPPLLPRAHSYRGRRGVVHLQRRRRGR